MMSSGIWPLPTSCIQPPFISPRSSVSAQAVLTLEDRIQRYVPASVLVDLTLPERTLVGHPHLLYNTRGDSVLGDALGLHTVQAHSLKAETDRREYDPGLHPTMPHPPMNLPFSLQTMTQSAASAFL